MDYLNDCDHCGNTSLRGWLIATGVEDGVPVVVLACSATCKSALTVRSDPAAQELLERTLLREED